MRGTDPDCATRDLYEAIARGDYPSWRLRPLTFPEWLRHEYKLGDVDFVQAGDLYRKVMKDEDREHLIGNIVSHLGGAQKRIQLRQTALFYKADPEYGERVARGLNLGLAQVKRLAAMSQEERVKATAT